MVHLPIIVIFAILGTATGFSVAPINQSGLFFDHQGTLLLKRGIWETKLHTRVYPKRDSEILRKIEKNLDIAFDKINVTDPKLFQIITILKGNCEHALQLMSETIKSRVKRSSGVFGILKDFIFGGDSIDEQLALFRVSEDEKMSHISDSLKLTNQ